MNIFSNSSVELNPHCGATLKGCLLGGDVIMGYSPLEKCAEPMVKLWNGSSEGDQI